MGKKSKERAEDGWPKAWKRPLYGPQVIAQDLIEAGQNLLKKVKKDEAARSNN